MGISKTYHLFLLILFLSIGSLLLKVETDKVFNANNRQLVDYQRVIGNYADWQGSSTELHEVLSKDFNFQFFQYIDDNDGSKNLTQGSLATSHSHWLVFIFNQPVTDIHKLAAGRLQIKLDPHKQIAAALDRIVPSFWLLIAVYFWLAGVFTLLMFRHKHAVGYAARYIVAMPQLTYDAIEASKLRGELAPLERALQSCRIALKQKMDDITTENEKLNQVAYQDQITGFGSRHCFIRKLESIANDSRQQIGSIAMIKATELAQINQLLGRSAGDDYLVQIATCIRTVASGYPDSEFFRISSADFAVFMPDMVIKDANKFLEPLKICFDDYQRTIKTESVAHTGLVPFTEGLDPVAVISLADMAVSIAQTLGPNSWHIQEKIEDAEHFGDDRWKNTIDDLLKRRALQFYQQPILPCRKDVQVYRELLTRFHNEEGKFLPTTTVFAMAERHGLVVELDKLVVVTAMQLLKKHPSLEGNFGINISASSALQEHFVAWLKDLCSKHKQLASRLVLEVNEAGMQSNIQGSFHFVKELHSVGVRISVERFGLGFTSFKFFKEVRPDYIKLDGSYTDDIAHDSNNKFFIRMIVDIARRLSMTVIATSVEHQNEKMALENLLVDGLQGYYIAQPQALSLS
jgi:RNase E specificity factor CsrD